MVKFILLLVLSSVSYSSPKEDFDRLSYEERKKEFISRNMMNQWKDLSSSGKKIRDLFSLREEIRKSLLEQARKRNDREFILRLDLFKVENLLYRGDSQARLEANRILSQGVERYSASRENKKIFFFLKGLYERHNEAHEKAIPFFQQAKALEEQIGLSDLKTLHRLAESLFLSGKHQGAVDVVNDGLAIAEKYQREGWQANFYSLLGSVYLELKEYSKAMDFQFKAIEIYKGQEKFHDVVQSLNGIALIKYDLGKGDEELSYFLDAEKYFHKEDVESDIKSLIYFNISGIYEIKKDYPKAEIYIKKAIKIAEEINNPSRVILSKLGLASIKIAIGKRQEIQEAISILKDVKKIDESYWEKQFLAWHPWHMANAYLQLGQYEKVKPFLKEAIILGEKYDQLNIDTVYDLAIKYYQGVGDYKNLYQYHKLKSDLDIKGLKEEKNELLYTKENEYKEQQNRLLKQENELSALKNQQQANKINNQRMIIVASILAVILLILFSYHAIRNARFIKFQASTIRRVVGNINEGIVLLNRDLSLYQEISSICYKLLPELNFDHGYNLDALLDSMNIDENVKSQIRESLKASFDNSSWQWEGNLHHLPTILQNQGNTQTLEFEWTPIYSAEDEVEQVIIVFRDVTDRLALEMELYNENRKNALTLTLLKVYRKNKASLDRYFRKTLANLKESILMLEKEDYKNLLFTMHTLKGSSRSLQFNEIANMIHKIETDIQKESKQKEEVHKKIQELHDNVQYTQDIYKNLFSGSDRGDDDKVDSLLLAQFSAISGLLPHVAESGLHIQKVTIENRTSPLEDRLVDDLSDAINHGISNAVDHGYLHPIKRGESEQTEMELELIIINNGGHLDLEIRDRGVGINENVIKELAKKRNFVPQDGQTVFDVLFESEVSTAGEVSKTSGRGVGTSAIKSIAESHNGEVHIGNREDGGSKISMRIPLSDLAADAS